MNSLDTMSFIQKQRIIKHADSIIKSPFVSVRDKTKSITNQPNNYESLATYYWPNTTNPNGRYISKDGMLNPEAELYCTPLIYSLSHKLEYVCKAYFLTNEEQYAHYAKKQILHWFTNPYFYMEPNFEYGQFIPGGTYTKGNIGAIAEAYYLIDAIEAIVLLRDNKYIDKKSDKKLKVWFSKLSAWMRTSVIGTKMKAANDNCSIMYDVLLYRISLYIADNTTCKEITENFTTMRLQKQITEEGRQPMELKRVNGTDYSIYNLNHIIDFCFMQEKKGIHYYAANVKRIEAAINYLYKIKDNNVNPTERAKITKHLQALRLRISRMNDVHL